MKLRILACLFLVVLPVAAALSAQSDGDFDHGFIAYSKTAPTDAVARLLRAREFGEVVVRKDLAGISRVAAGRLLEATP